MTAGRKRGAQKHGHMASPKARAPSAKERHRAEEPGRAEQGLGRAGRSGGTKSSGGRAGREHADRTGQRRRSAGRGPK